VFPKALRLDVPTDWRICQHIGSRYHDELPMNVTALKTMRKHWAQCMQALLPIRQAYMQRFPHLRTKGWTVGDLQRLTTLVLTLPAYLHMRVDSPVENGELHPVLSNLFRITDGARMALHYQLFMPVHEPTMPPDTCMTSDALYQYAERNNLFLSDHGVCAGPSGMIQEFLRVLIDGDLQPTENAFDEAVQAALNALQPALDYELLALRVHAVVNALWPLMIRMMYWQPGRATATQFCSSCAPAFAARWSFFKTIRFLTMRPFVAVVKPCSKTCFAKPERGWA